MFTSRAEYRLSLREDNADSRLTEAGYRMGLVDEARWEIYARKRDAVAQETERLKATWVNPAILSVPEAERVLGQAIEHEYNLFDLLRRPAVRYEGLMSWSGVGTAVEDSAVVEQLEIEAKYAGYVDRQREEVEHGRLQEETRLPDDIDYAQIHGLSIEVRQKLNQLRPATLGQAARISGVTPAAVSVLQVHLKRRGMGGRGA